MAETLNLYVASIKNEVDDSSQRAQNVIERAVKDTYQEIIRIVAPFLVGTTEEDKTATANQRYVTPTNSFMDVKSVLWKNTSSSTYYKLDPMREEEYYSDYVNRDPGDPLKFYLNAGNIYFDVAPSTAGTVKISGIVVPSELTTGDSAIPDRFTKVVLEGSIARFKAYEGVPDANEYMSMYRGPYFEQGKVGGSLKTMMDELATKQPMIRPKLFGRN